MSNKSSKEKFQSLLKSILPMTFIVVVVLLVEIFLLTFTFLEPSAITERFAFITLIAILTAIVAYMFLNVISIPAHRLSAKGIIVEGDPKKIGFEFVPSSIKLIEFDRARLNLAEKKFQARIYLRDTRVCTILMDIETGVFEVTVRKKRRDEGYKILEELMSMMDDIASKLQGKVKIVSMPQPEHVENTS